MSTSNTDEFPAFEQLSERLDGFDSENGHYRAMCPAHEGHRPALTIQVEGEAPSRKLLVHCHAECGLQDILDAVGLEKRDLFESSRKSKKTRKNGPMVEAYDYTDVAGQLLFQVVRYRDPKEFSQRRPDGKGGWIWKTSPTPVLYNLPAVMRAAMDGGTVFICEGEKDCNRATKDLGGPERVFTTSPQGALNWRDEFTQTLRGAHVVLLPDRDDKGKAHMDKVGDELVPVARSVRVLELPGEWPAGESGFDISDWLDAGGTFEAFDDLTQLSSTFSPIGNVDVDDSWWTQFGAVRLVDIGDPEPNRYLVRGFVEESQPTYVYGGSGTLKSITVLALAIAIASPEVSSLCGFQVENHGPVVIFDSEMNQNKFNQRAKEICGGLGINPPSDLYYKNAVGIDPTESFPALHALAEKAEAVAVVIDSLGFATRSNPENYEDVRDDVANYIHPLTVKGISPIVVDHKPHQGDHCFGSVIKGFHARTIFKVEDLDGEDHVQGVRNTRLINKKASFGEDGHTINLTTHFGGGEIRIENNAPAEPKDSQVDNTAPGKVKQALTEGDQTKPEIAIFTGYTEEYLANVLPKMIGDGSIFHVGAVGRQYVYSLDPGRRDQLSSTSTLHRENDVDDSCETGPNVTQLFPQPDPCGTKKNEKPPTSEKKKRDKNPTSILAIARANRLLREDHNLIYRRQDVGEVREWLKKTSEVALDTETYGAGASAGERRKMALSFVRGQVRLIQLSANGETYLIDARLLHKEDVSSILKELQGKAILCHNAIFDLPRIKRHFGVDLMSDDVRDTLVLSRLARAGEWEENEDSDPVAMRHGLGEILKREGVANLDKEVDHKWEEPLTDERLRYATDDVRYLQNLRDALMELVEKRDLAEGLELFRDVYPAYLKMQYEGQPVDEARLEEYTQKLADKVEHARAALEEYQPDHPDGGSWSWGNKQPFDEDEPSVGPGRNGARRALHLAGIEISNLKKSSRMAYLKKHSDASPLLHALNDYYHYSSLLSDCKDWLTYFVEDGRIFANVKAFSQVTGRSAYANPALQNAPKEVDEAVGMSLRDCIKPQEGHTLIKADYAAQELRILAEVTGDAGLIASFGGGEDPHVRVAEKIAGRSLPKEDPEYTKYRKLGKRANYGFSYGAGAERYRTSVFEDTYERISLKQAKLEQAAFRKTWPGVHTWQQASGSRDGTSETDWYTTSFTERRRYVSPKWDTFLGSRKPNYCDRLNGPIQAGGADMLYIALKFLLQDQSAGIYENVRIIITTHDEIVLEVLQDDLAGVKDWLEVAMRAAAKEFLRDELTGSDCVEAEEVPSWGGR